MSTTWRPPQLVRPLAIGLIRRGADLLVAAVQDDAGAVVGWRPPGGTIEFRERAADALRREMLEELGLAVTEPAQLAVMENFYEHNGAPGHEIVFVFETAFVDPDGYRRDRFQFAEGDVECWIEWIDIGRFRSGDEKLLPRGLLDRI